MDLFRPFWSILVSRMLKSSSESGHFDQNGRLDHFRPVHFPTVPRPLPKLSRPDPCSVDFSRKTPKFRFEFCRGFFCGFFPPVLSKEKGPKNPPKNPPQNSPGTLFEKISLGFLQKPFLDKLLFAKIACFARDSSKKSFFSEGLGSVNPFKTGVYPYPIACEVCETKSKNGRSRHRNPLFLRVFCAQRGVETMVSEGARPWGRDRSGDCKKSFQNYCRKSFCRGGSLNLFCAFLTTPGK